MTLLCLLAGHTDDLRMVPGRLAVACRHCGRVSRGITLGLPGYRRTQPPKGDPRRLKRYLTRAWVSYRLEGAA